MLVAAIACVAGLAAVLVAVYRDQELRESRIASDWDPLPSPSEIASVAFPLAFRGYHPGMVDAHLERLRQAYGDLLAAAPPEVVELARRQAARRMDPGEADTDDPAAAVDDARERRAIQDAAPGSHPFERRHQAGHRDD